MQIPPNLNELRIATLLLVCLATVLSFHFLFASILTIKSHRATFSTRLPVLISVSSKFTFLQPVSIAMIDLIVFIYYLYFAPIQPSQDALMTMNLIHIVFHYVALVFLTFAAIFRFQSTYKAGPKTIVLFTLITLLIPLASYSAVASGLFFSVFVILFNSVLFVADTVLNIIVAFRLVNGQITSNSWEFPGEDTVSFRRNGKARALKIKYVCYFVALLVIDLFAVATYVLSRLIYNGLELKSLACAISTVHIWVCLRILQVFLKDFDDLDENIGDEEDGMKEEEKDADKDI